jgi:hypothetical protein
MAVTIDPPLTFWYCDVCDELIYRNKEAETLDEKPGKVPPAKTGIVTWSDPPRSERDPSSDETPVRPLPTDYRVVHKITCDDGTGVSWETDSLLGIEGLQLWSELLWHGKASEPLRLAPGTTLNPTMDLMFRFQVPHYEQARRYLNTQFAQSYLDGRVVLSDEGYKAIIKSGSLELHGD